MIEGRVSCLIVNTIYFLIAISAFTNIVVGCVLTAIAVSLLFVYRIPIVPNETVASRLKKQTTKEDVGHDDKRNIVLHRAGVLDLPENTLESVKLAHECGAGAVEIDLEFTEDGVGVLMHDDTVDRTTDGCGHISKLNYESVRKLDAAAKHCCRGKTGPMQVPTLEECISECLRLDLHVYIDCKSQPQKTAELLSKLFREHPDLYNNAIVCSFYPQLIYAVRKKDPAILTALTHRKHYLAKTGDGQPRYKELWKRVVFPVLDVLLEWSLYSWLWFALGNSFFLMQKDDVSGNTVKYWKNLGIQVVPWTVNDPKEKDYIQHCLKCPVITDGMNSK